MLEYKSSVDIYGAGKRADVCIPILDKFFEIRYVFDLAKRKIGGVVFGKNIIAPSHKLFGQMPIIVTVYDINSVIETLKMNGITNNVFWCASNSSRDLILVEISCEDNFSILYEKMWRLPINQNETFIIKENVDELKKGKRIFNIASPSDFDGPGGPVACLRNMWIANGDYHLIENFFTACPAIVYTPKGVEQNFDTMELEFEPISPSKELLMIMKKYTKSHRSLSFLLNICRLTYFLRDLDKKFKFTSDDVFLLQDTFILLAFMYQFPDIKRIATAYHGQGVMSSELKKSNPDILDIMDEVQLLQLQKIKHWIFPSKGAIEGFLQTATPAMKEAAKSCKFHVAYNGYEKKDRIYPDENFFEFLDTVKADVVFASATLLYRNKGVERIPKILSEFKKITGAKIHWVLVGGGEMEKEVEGAIEQFLDEGECTWFKKRFDNQDNIFALFKKADFYIMMHRVSVFDLSTLQAMAYECVPFLSNIGGNKELCGFDNGILCDPEKEGLNLKCYYQNGKWDRMMLDKMKKKNLSIIKDKFNNYEFLLGYYSVLDELEKSLNVSDNDGE